MAISFHFFQVYFSKKQIFTFDDTDIQNQHSGQQYQHKNIFQYQPRNILVYNRS